MLARRPQLALVDEFAHTNAPAAATQTLPGRRGAARDAGIDVLQHAEHPAPREPERPWSRSFTRVRVRETVPDSRCSIDADEIEIDRPARPTNSSSGCAIGQSLPAPHEASRALAQLLLASRTSPRCANSPCAAHGPGASTDELLDQVADRRRAPATWAAGERVSWSAVGDQPGVDGRSWCATPNAWPTALHAPWTVAMQRGDRPRSATLSPRRGPHPQSPTPSSWPRRAWRHDGRQCRRGPVADAYPLDDMLAKARGDNVTQMVIGKSRQAAALVRAPAMPPSCSTNCVRSPATSGWHVHRGADRRRTRCAKQDHEADTADPCRPAGMALRRRCGDGRRLTTRRGQDRCSPIFGGSQHRSTFIYYRRRRQRHATSGLCAPRCWRA